MSICEIMSKTEDATIRLEKARVVLIEATKYIERKVEPDTWQAYTLIHSLENMLLLLHVADDYLRPAIDQANEVVSLLCDRNKKEGERNAETQS